MAPAVLEHRGEPIKGSRFYRNWCQHCGEPIRVSAVLRQLINVSCDSCRHDAEAAAKRLRRLQAMGVAS